MAKLVWDETAKHLFETGVDRGVLFVMDSSKDTYGKGVAWSGLTGVTETRSGADETELYADNIKYLGLRGAEKFGGTITAYFAPDEWKECDGESELVPGVSISQQKRKVFAFCYRTLIGNDTEGQDHGYKIHLVYGATASPSNREYQTVNDSPEAVELSWDFSTTPINVTGFKPTSHLEVDSTKFTADKIKALEDKIYGTDSEEPTLPLPDEVATLLKVTA